MTQTKANIAILLGDPAGIGPELISKLLKNEMTKKANIVIIGEKQVFESGNSITGISHNVDVVENFDQIDFNKANRFLLDISKGKNYKYKLAEPSKESGESVLEALDLALTLATLIWQDIASSNPPPSAKPLTAAITGVDRFSTKLNNFLNKSLLFP